MAHALGMKSKMIVGYKGTGDMNIAIQRGEVDGRVVSEESAALYGPSNGMRVVTVLARTRVEQFPQAPTLFESAQLTPEQARLIDWRASIAGLGRLMLVTPGTPPTASSCCNGPLPRSSAIRHSLPKPGSSASRPTTPAPTRCAPRSNRR